jgi:hypothetical protein
MAKKGFDLKDAGNIPSGPVNASDPSRKWYPASQTINNESTRTGVAKNPTGERTA